MTVHTSRYAPFALILLCLGFQTILVAQPSASRVCEDIAAKAQRTLWNSVRESGDELFCRKPWTDRSSEEFASCFASTTVNNFGNKIKNKMNRFFDEADALWATWGPRGIGVQPEIGTIRGGFKRTYFGAGLAFHNSTITVEKTGGRAQARITVCELDHNGDVVASHRRTISNGQGTVGTTRTVSFENPDTRVIGIVVDTPASVNSLQYQVTLANTPNREYKGPVQGIADLHVHQFMNLAMGGRMYWGEPYGPVARALAPEVITGGIQPSDGITVKDVLDVFDSGVDAQILMMAQSGGKIDDEGFFRIGGGGFPNFESWPHHADRTHQQVHWTWLREAHQRLKVKGRNLNLMVLSLVNNNILCGALRVLDPTGNIPEWDANGNIAGWKSASFGCSDHENIMRQIEAAHQMERDLGWYKIAMSPWHARQIISEGGLAVVLSIETDKPLSSEGGNYGNWEDQLDFYRSMGVTTMQLVHESNSRFAGAALHRDMMEVLQAIRWPVESIRNAIDTGNAFRVDAQGRNMTGLTAEGHELVEAMVQRNMPIDLAHMSWRAKARLFSQVPANYGLYDSHTKFERLLMPDRGETDHGNHVLDREQEFFVHENQLQDYVDHHVLVGLRPAPVDVYDAPTPEGKIKADYNVANDCPGSSKSFAQMVQYATDSGLRIAFGSDFNTGVSQLGPRFGPGRCFAALPELENTTSRPVGPAGRLPARARQIGNINGTNYYRDGLPHIGWLPELAEDLVGLGTPGSEQLAGSAENYLKMWERAYTAGGVAAGVATIDVTDLPMGDSCRNDDECSTGRCSSVDGFRGVCVCNGSEDCPGGQFCNMGLDLRTNACEPLRADNEVCDILAGGSDCASGNCRFGRCYTPNSVPMGGVCYNDDACSQGKCSAVDGFRGSCVCQNDGDCGGGFWCDRGLDLTVNSCKPKLPDGAVCGLVGEINVGHRCTSGKCRARPLRSLTNLFCTE